MRDMLAMALNDAGFNVVQAVDGEDGLAVLDAHSADVDVIITDINMPKLDGFGFIEGVRKDARHRATPILVLTSESDSSKKDRAGLAGAVLLGAVAFGGEHEDRRGPVTGVLAHALDEAEAVQLGHVDVGDDHVDIGGMGVQDGQAVFAVNGLDHIEAGVVQGHGEHVAHGPGIVDREDGLAQASSPSVPKAWGGSLKPGAANMAQASSKAVEAWPMTAVWPSACQVLRAEISTCRQSPPSRSTCDASMSSGWPRSSIRRV